MKSHGAFLVPTLATYDSLSREGKALGWLDSMLDKLAMVKGEGINAIRIARDAGVPVGFGTDLLGHMHDDQSNEFLLRSAAQSAAEVLQSATSVNAQILNQQGRLGVIAKGALADLIVVDGDPTVNLSLLTGQGENLPLIMKGGQLYKNRLPRAISVKHHTSAALNQMRRRLVELIDLGKPSFGTVIRTMTG